MHTRRQIMASLLAALTVPAAPRLLAAPAPVALLNVSYDPTRELYVEVNAAFARHWRAESGQEVSVKQSHGGSGKQARSILDGLEADVATLALAGDTDALHTVGKLIPENWQARLPNNSSPYTSTIILVTRKGNPKNIKDWGDLVRPDIKVITPNPKTSGGARWNYLAAWDYAQRAEGGTDPARAFIRRLYRNVPVLDTGARAASISFSKRNQGDVLISWENEAFLLKKEMGDQIELVYPARSILAEPAVTVIDRNVDRKGTRAVAEAYLKFLYTDEAQNIIGRHFYRPVSDSVLSTFSGQFKKIELFTIQEAFGGWQQATKTHFAEGGTFDQIYSAQ